MIVYDQKYDEKFSLLLGNDLEIFWIDKLGKSATAFDIITNPLYKALVLLKSRIWFMNKS